MEKGTVVALTEGGYSVIFATFLQESIGHMIPWLVVSFFVIICDLVVGIRKCLLMGEEVRFSSACRRSIGKIITYLSFVIMVAVIDVAANGGGTIDKYACLSVCFIEGCSIIGNILKPKGINFNVINAIHLFCKKTFSVDKEDVKEIFEKDETK